MKAGFEVEKERGRAAGEELENDGFTLIGLLFRQVKGQMTLQVLEQGTAEILCISKHASPAS